MLHLSSLISSNCRRGWRKPNVRYKTKVQEIVDELVNCGSANQQLSILKELFKNPGKKLQRTLNTWGNIYSKDNLNYKRIELPNIMILHPKLRDAIEKWYVYIQHLVNDILLFVALYKINF